MDTRKDNKVCNFSLFINISIVEFSGCAQFVRGIVPLVYIQAPALVVAPRVVLRGLIKLISVKNGSEMASGYSVV